ncbi:MAG: NADH-quinone oxidoreductase subunit C [Armatimonadota bacterium]|nr:MAG: NADH-quinone oxidoreductase subunit C [Armatimonadota bacterium]
MALGRQIVEGLRAKIGSSLLEVRQPQPHSIYAKVEPAAVLPAADCIANQLGGRFLITAGTDQRPTTGDYCISHIFSFDKDKLFFTLQSHVPPGREEIDAITPVVPGAAWAEREMRDMVGVSPRNHPDPRRLVLADDWPDGVYPLRKDFPYDEKPASTPEAKPALLDPPEGASVLPIGPFFPVLEEPAYFRLFVEGETVVGCDYRGFYNHRGIEKLGDSVLNYNQIPFVAERICGICGYIHACCYCQAIEEAAQIEVPARAQYIRTIMLELERVHSHMLWLGIAGHIIGFDTVLMQTWRVREPVMWLCEKITGNRKTYGMNLIGGVRRDIPKESHPEILEVLDKIEKEWLAIIDAIVGDTPLMMRLRGVGVIPEEVARRIAIVGPSGRGSNMAIDSRVDHPYAAYADLGVQIKVHSDGDVLARTMVRLEEVVEAVRLIRLALKQMPDGPIINNLTEEIPEGLEGISVVEAPRGEAIHYVMTGPDNRPARWRVRAPTYANLQAVPPMIQGDAIADVPIAVGSLDPCFSCTERMEIVDRDTNRHRILSYDDLMELSRTGRGGARR